MRTCDLWNDGVANVCSPYSSSPSNFFFTATTHTERESTNKHTYVILLYHRTDSAHRLLGQALRTCPYQSCFPIETHILDQLWLPPNSTQTSAALSLKPWALSLEPWAMSLEPWALSHEPWAMSHEPWSFWVFNSRIPEILTSSRIPQILSSSSPQFFKSSIP